MKEWRAVVACMLLGFCGQVSGLQARAQSVSDSSKKESIVHHASGPFDVKVIPQDKADDTGIGRMLLDKQYHGDLEATAKGQMLAAGSPAQGAGGYVAIEKVTGTLQGRKGSFVLQHTGTMSKAGVEMTITVVPESGTGELQGIVGKLTITIASDGKHTYDFEYTLP